MRLRKILPALNVIRSTKESLIYELTWEVSIQKKPHTSANSVKSLSIIPIPLHLTSEFILARMWEIKSNFFGSIFGNLCTGTEIRKCSDDLSRNIWKKISGSLSKNVQNMATTTQLIQKYKTIQKSTSSVPTVLYLKLRLFLTDSDRMCDSDILTIYSYAKLAQASLRAYQVREAPLKFMQALFEGGLGG